MNIKQLKKEIENIPDELDVVIRIGHTYRDAMFVSAGDLFFERNGVYSVTTNCPIQAQRFNFSEIPKGSRCIVLY